MADCENESQRAMVAKRLAQLPVGANQHRGSANLPTLSQAEAVKTLYVSERAVRHAAVVQEKAVPELVAAVERGDIPFSTAPRAWQSPDGCPRSTDGRTHS